ncbi:hypothetical protein CPB83DRAFT_858044 [Crepidotus variabilis]|uniref:Nucleoporin p58/p45 n=1 Tax=Crepidotus variabilis TaxID=179855 RepID=A0A9P6ECG2_9AGAR|nr:hypothetical protein CPB83DRAFT_858044 [Crepidotus variabilis]
MAFATNSSAFGIKPATTGTSLFGQQQQQQVQQGQQSSLFSGFGQQNPQQNQAQPTTSLFGQPQQPAANNAGGSLFGQNQPSTTGGGLFGQSTQQQPQQGATGGLFGQPQQQNQQGTGGLFGQTQAQPQPAGGGLFGQPQAQQQGSSLFGGGSLFGNPTPQQQQPQQQTGGLFGSTNNQTTNALRPQATLPAGAFGASTGTSTNTFGGLFGNNIQQQPQQQQQQQQAPSIFGNNGPPQNTGLNTFGHQSSLNASSATGPPPFTKSTKFNDLPDHFKSILENIDTHIQGRVQICKDLQQRKLGEEPTKGHEAIRNIQKDLANTAATIRNDLHVTQDLKAKVDQAVEDTIVATRIIDGFRNPQSGHTYLKDHSSFPLEYFTRVTDQMKQRLDWYKSTIEQIERKLASATSSTQTPQNISATLQAQHAIFLTLASKTAAVDLELQKIKTLYTQLWRAKTGSVRDPFGDGVKANEKNTGDFGLSQLNVK